MAEPSRENAETAIPTGLPGPGFHVLDRFTNSYRKQVHLGRLHMRSIQWHLKKNWRVPGITRKGDPNPQVPAPPFTMVAEGRQYTYRPTITPNITCSANIYRSINRRVGPLLGEHTARGTWSLPGSKLHITLELKAVFLALKEFLCSNLSSNKIVLVATNNTTVVSYINKEVGMSGPLCTLLNGES